VALLADSTVLPPINGTKTLDEYGISKTQSSRWQKIAAIPDDEAEKKIDAATGKRNSIARQDQGDKRADYRRVAW
jgi:hypothetical protein